MPARLPHPKGGSEAHSEARGGTSASGERLVTGRALFGRALAAAASSRLPLLEVIAARDWKRAMPASGSAADAALDAACAKMGRSRAELALVL